MNTGGLLSPLSPTTNLHHDRHLFSHALCSPIRSQIYLDSKSIYLYMYKETKGYHPSLKDTITTEGTSSSNRSSRGAASNHHRPTANDNACTSDKLNNVVSGDKNDRAHQQIPPSRNRRSARALVVKTLRSFPPPTTISFPPRVFSGQPLPRN